MCFSQVTRIVYLVLAVGMGLVNLPCEGAKRRFSVADDIRVAHFGDPYTGKTDAVTFSPDGQYFVVYTERGLLDQDRPEGTLRIYRTKDVQQFLLHHEMTGEPSPAWTFSKSTYKDGPVISHIRWLGDSSAIAFLAKTVSGSDELLLGDLRSKTIQALTQNDQHVTAFDILDRNHFVYTVESPTILERAVRDTQAASVVATGQSLNRLIFPTDLYAFMSKIYYDLSELWAVVNGKRFRVPSESSSLPIFLHWDAQSALALSPDGRSVLTVMALRVVPPEWETLYPPALPSDIDRIRASRQDLEGWEGYRYVSEYVVIELSSGKVTPLTNAPIGRNAGWWSGLNADWSLKDESVVLVNTFLPPKVHDPDGELNRPCVAVVDLRKGYVTCLERLKGKAKTKSGYEDGYRYVDSAHFTAGNGGRLTVDYWEDGSKRSRGYIRSNDGLWTISATMNGWTEHDRGMEIDVMESFTDAPVLVASDKLTKATRIILDPNPQLKDLDLGTASVYKWKDRNGRDWVGGLYKPSDYEQGQRYPLVVQTHGFFETIFRPDGIFPTAFAARELAAAEMLVLQVPDCPYTSTPEEISCNVSGYEAGVEKLVADGMVDPRRIGIVGFSRTCSYVLAALTRSSLRFTAASITDGVNNGYLQYITRVDTAGNSIPQDAAGVIGASPFGEGLQRWLSQSPEFNMEKVKTPLQVVALGRPDVLFMWEPYAALKFLNKPVDLIMLRQGTHVLTNPSERLVSQGGTVDWFRFWLKGEEDRDPAKAEQYARWHELRKLQEKNEGVAAQSVSQ